MSDDVIAVTIDGVSSADLEASSGKFELTSKTSIEGAEPSSFNWTAPWTDKGRTVKFTLTDPVTGEVIATASIRVEPILTIRFRSSPTPSPAQRKLKWAAWVGSP